MKKIFILCWLLMAWALCARAQVFVYKDGEVVFMMPYEMADSIVLSSSDEVVALVENNYRNIPHKTTCYWNVTFNWGEDEILPEKEDFEVTNLMDNGAFDAYYTSWGGNHSYLYGNQQDESTDRMNHHLWNGAWSSINYCNAGLRYMDEHEMPDFSDAEKKLMRGELLFFRAWWYEELMVHFGGMPYTDVEFDGTLPDMERLSFRECADLAVRDFSAAAELLPDDWDRNEVGEDNYGNNGLKITRAVALAYAGKVMLWASSPLYENGAQTGGLKTYDYNVEYAGRAAEFLGRSLALIESGQTPYSLANYYDADDYVSLYNHDRYRVAGSCFSDIFYTVKRGFLQPGSCEAMMRGSAFQQENDARWGFCTTWGSNVNGLFAGSYVQVPTANYVNYAYGMANGLPLDDPDSGFDPTHPYRGRDPRFYHDIVFDGERYIESSYAYGYEDQQYTTLYSGGLQRNEESGSRTGYFCQKLVPHTGNAVDKVCEDWGVGFKSYLPYMRVADVYLMYAEACAAMGGARAKSTTFNKTAEDALNVLRDRVGAGHVGDKYTADRKLFMDEVRRERACELAFEGFRVFDLQRWLLVTEEKYAKKTSQEFDRVSQTDDPRDIEVANWREELILKRDLDEKHYFLPLPHKDLNDKVTQNPGWEYLADEEEEDESTPTE